MTKLFSLTVSSLDTGDKIVFEHSTLICNYRDTILDVASKLGAITNDNYTLVMPGHKEFSKFLFFIGLLQIGTFDVTFHGNKEGATFKRTSSMEEYWKSITKHAKELGGSTNLTGGFDFDDYVKFCEFLDYIRSIEIMDGYEKIKI